MIYRGAARIAAENANRCAGGFKIAWKQPCAECGATAAEGCPRRPGESGRHQAVAAHQAHGDRESYGDHVMSDEFWKPIETAPEHPDCEYLAVDINGYVHRTTHPRHTLMHAGWAEAWAPAYKPKPITGSIRDGGREIAAMHAREFKRLVRGHHIENEVIEGVAVVEKSAAK